MWEYKVIAGRYAIDGSDVVVENPLGRGTMQRILDHYAGEGFELVDTHLDNLNHEVILTLRKPKGGVLPQGYAAPAAQLPYAAAAPLPQAPGLPAQPAAVVDDDDELPARRRGGGSSGGRRRSKAELDRLYRDA